MQRTEQREGNIEWEHVITSYSIHYTKLYDGASIARYVANRFRFWIWPVLVALPIATGIGIARNAIVARAALCLIAIGGGYGTIRNNFV